MAIYAVSDIMAFVTQWEASILKSYQAIQAFLSSDTAVNDLMVILEKDQNRLMESLRLFKVKDAQSVEFLKNLRNYSVDPPVRSVELSGHASVDEILDDVMRVHEDLLNEYKHLRVLASYERTRDIFDILIQLKTSQIKKICSYMELYGESVLLKGREKDHAGSSHAKQTDFMYQRSAGFAKDR